MADFVKLRESADWVTLKHTPVYEGGSCGYCAGAWPCYYRRLADYALSHKRVRDAHIDGQVSANLKAKPGFVGSSPQDSTNVADQPIDGQADGR